MMNELPPGTRVIIWGRPEPDLVLLFGEGFYEGSTYINGNYWPTVRLTNGKEITVHQMGVEVGRADAVADVCKRFNGDVLEWSLEKYLHGQRPTREQRVKAELTTASMAPPKTATDKVLFLRREIAVEESRIELAQQMIDKSREVIAAKKREIAELTQAVLGELVAVNPDIASLLKEAPQFSPIPPTTPTPVVATTPIVKPIVTTEAPVLEVDDHTKLAVED